MIIILVATIIALNLSSLSSLALVVKYVTFYWKFQMKGVTY
jgi:hypothetical protein